MAIAEALPAILETLAYVAAGAVTIIAYALSRTERPKRRYLELGISGACLGLLVALAGWILWAESRSTPPRSFAGVEETQEGRALRVTITKRSGENSNELRIALPRGVIAKLLHGKARRQSEQDGRKDLVPVCLPVSEFTRELLKSEDLR
jgi:hypothetical protein